jgi:Fe-S cluster assembly protein SufD
MSVVADALEVERVDSHLHPHGSFDVDGHPVPTGREEIWRFTPLKRLRGLHADASLAGSGVEVDYDVPDSVVVESLTTDDPRLGSSGFVPTDRIAARVWHESGRRFAVSVPADRH